MGYIYLILVALFFSFGGTCVKMIKPFFQPSMITFMRSFVGVLWLLGLKAVKRQPFRSDYKQSLGKKWGWLLFGAVTKFLAYTVENTALSIGVSYGNILVHPVQIVLLTILGATVLKEKMNAAKWTGVICCVIGVLLISWNGMSISTLMEGSLSLTAMFIVAGVFAGLFIFAQKKVAGDFDILDSNLTMFAAAAVMAFIVPLAQGNVLPAAVPDVKCVIAILFFGFVTGIGFYLNAKAIPLVSFQMVALLQSTMVFFSIAWGILFFHEPVSVWIIAGTLLFVAGIAVMQKKSKE